MGHPGCSGTTSLGRTCTVYRLLDPVGDLPYLQKLVRASCLRWELVDI